MGEVNDNAGFAVKDDGTIVRNRKCTKCGKMSSSVGEYCEYCGHKFPKAILTEGLDYERTPKKWLIIIVVLGTIFFGIVGIWGGYYFNSAVECNGVLHYRFNKKTRQWGRWAMIVSVLSVIFWVSRLYHHHHYFYY